jgi:hypothetical protein
MEHVRQAGEVARKRERIVHDYELERPIPGPDRSSDWWLSTHGASGVGNVKRKVKKQNPTWPIVLLLLMLVLVVTLALLLFLDLRKGKLWSPWPENANSTTPTSLRMDAVSVDTVKGWLVVKGFEVEHLQTVTDPRLLAYEYAQTYIDAKPAQIMTFKDEATAKRWIRNSDIPTISKDTWVIAVNNEELAQKMAKALKGDLHG